MPQDTFGTSDPFLRISRLMEDGNTLPVFKTEALMRTLNPVWKPIDITLQQLCNSDRFRPLLLECFDWNKSGSHEIIGQAQMSLDDLMRQ